jgi:hypothetical protein
MTIGIRRSPDSQAEWVRNIAMLTVYVTEKGYLLIVNYFGDNTNYDIECSEFLGAKDSKQIDLEKGQ